MMQDALRRAMALHQQGRLAEAEALYRAVLAAAPDNVDARHLLGVIALQVKNFPAAVELIGGAVQREPRHAAAQSNLGAALLQLGRDEAALTHLDHALALAPDFADALNNRAIVLRRLGRREAALASYDRVVALEPDHADALSNRGNVLRDLGRTADALDSYDRALARRPDDAETLTRRGGALLTLGRPAEALQSFDRALALRPDHAETLLDRGAALRDLKRHEEALAAYDHALALLPASTDALAGRGTILRDLGRVEPALAALDQALTLDPDHRAALLQRAEILREQMRYEAAARDYEHLLALAPEAPYLAGEMLLARNQACDWQGYPESLNRITGAIREGRPAAAPFAFLTLSDSPEDQLRCAKLFSEDRYPVTAPALWAGERYRHDRIRLAYLSADFHDHATAYLMAELFERHDRGRFETLAVSFGPVRHGAMRARLETAFDRFEDVADRPDGDVARLLREAEIDIAVDLKGYTQGFRPRLLMPRPAPIQVSHIGYPGTLGLPWIDYLIADDFLVPEMQRACYTEQIVTLPGYYAPYDTVGPPRDADVPTRPEVGLPEHGFVFCSFNNSHKITPSIFDVWMRLLQAVEGSVLWLLADNPGIMAALRGQAAARGVTADRLVFAPRLDRAAHLARHALGDLMLDTLPYNAHTTAIDALWCGLPVLTCPGASFAARVAGSLLTAAGLPELVVPTLDAYEALALRLAREPAQLAALKQRAAALRSGSVLFDTGRYCRQLESAYETMWTRCQRGEPPAAFAVAPG